MDGSSFGSQYPEAQSLWYMQLSPSSFNRLSECVVVVVVDGVSVGEVGGSTGFVFIGVVDESAEGVQSS
mgnify:CR=1 FL=1